MRKYTVTGMSCAACSARVENAVKGLKGVKTCSVNLLTQTLSLDGTVSDEAVIKAVEKAGYGIKADISTFDNSINEKKQIKALLKRLISSSVFLLVLMYISMGYTMWGFPLPDLLAERPLFIGIIQLILTLIVAVINRKFFISGIRAVVKLSPNMDTLVALGSASAFVYSLWQLFLLYKSQSHEVLHNLYFESAAMILTLITVGKLLEAVSKGKTTDAIKKLVNMAPKTATVIRDGTEKTVNADEVLVGDVFLVKAGESIPVDATVIEGNGAVDESALTGESIPVDKKRDDTVFAATINQSGFLKCVATRVGRETAFSQIIEMVSNATSTKAPISRIADKVSGVFVPVVIFIAIITCIVWLLIGQPFGAALEKAIAVLVISCPCSLGLATPVAIMVGSGVGAKRGILFKNAEILENAGKTDIIVLDKTGTVTKGHPAVTDIIAKDERSLLKIAASAEKNSEHPLSIAVTERAARENVTLFGVQNFEVHSGSGVVAEIDCGTAVGGNLSFIEKYCTVSEEIKQRAKDLSMQGKTPLFFALNSEFIGIIAVADAVKEDSRDAVKKINALGIKTVMLTGDNEYTARAVAKEVGISEVYAQVMPLDKEKKIQELKKQGRVMMVGDGINDAPSLTAADIGVAMASGSDIAANLADIVLMNNRISDVFRAVNLSRKVMINIRENLFWAFVYNCLGIPLAAGVFESLLGLHLSPMFAAAAMSLSSFFVVTNALRINFYNINSCVKRNKKSKEKNTMEIVLKVEGMMCEHCEARVKGVLTAVKGVISAEVDHKDGTAKVVFDKKVKAEKLIKAIEEAGYKVIS